MKKEIRCLICIIIGIIYTVVWIAIIGVTDNNQKKHNLDTTTETTFQSTTFQGMTEATEELTNEEPTAKETTMKPMTKESTVKEEQPNYVNCDVPSNNTIKSYMDYRTITLTNSRQYKLQKSLAYTDSNGLRMVNGRYCVAVGSYYTTTIGQYIDIELENGEIIKGVLADCKADKDTDSTNKMHPDGSVVEFVVDVNVLDNTAKKMGDISYINGWDSKVVNIKVYDKIEEF